jgi:hypothetical protein
MYLKFVVVSCPTLRSLRFILFRDFVCVCVCVWGGGAFMYRYILLGICR